MEAGTDLGQTGTSEKTTTPAKPPCDGPVTSEQVPTPAGLVDSSCDPPGADRQPQDVPSSTQTQEDPPGTGNITEAGESPDPCNNHKERIRRNIVYLVDNLEPDRLILSLRDRDLIGTNQWNELHDLLTHTKTERLIDIVYRGPPELFKGFTEELEKDNQQAIAQCLTADGKTVALTVDANHLKSNQRTLVENIRFEGGLLSCLEKHRVLTSDKVEEVKECVSRRTKVELLLRFVMKGLTDVRLHGLITALKDTGQPHLAALIQSGDKSQMVPSELKDMLTSMKYDLTQAAASKGLHDLRLFVSSMVQEGQITWPQGELILSKPTAEEQAEELVDIVRTRPYTKKHDHLIDSQAWKPLPAEQPQKAIQGSGESTMSEKTPGDAESKAQAQGGGNSSSCADVKEPNLDNTNRKKGGDTLGDTITTNAEARPKIGSRHVYRMDHPKRGIFIVINNKTFDSSTHMNTRAGSDVDAANLYMQFKTLGFEGHLYNDLRSEQMLKLVNEVAKMDHSQSDMFAMAILSHGEEGVVYGIDGEVALDNLFSPLKGDNCESLIGKPKFIIIQADRGSRLDNGVETKDMGEISQSTVAGANISGSYRAQQENASVVSLSERNASGGSKLTEEPDIVKRIPTEADFLYAYSTPTGYFSWRNSTKGSWFIHALTQVLQEHGDAQEIMWILTQTNYIVANEFQSNASQEFMNKKKQIPSIVSQLTKQLYLTPKSK